VEIVVSAMGDVVKWQGKQQATQSKELMSRKLKSTEYRVVSPGEVQVGVSLGRTPASDWPGRALGSFHLHFLLVLLLLALSRFGRQLPEKAQVDLE
jgi:hypothetical protein